MNKLEMITYLQGIYAAVNPVYERVEKDINGNPIAKFDGGKWCVIQVREVDSIQNTANYKGIYVYIIDDGLATESVFFKADSAPAEVLPVTEEITP
jgi:hypothetical protein